MNIYFLIAGVLCNLLGIFHSVLGEYLIFKNKRLKGKFIPTKSNPDLSKRHLGIIWATWHLASVFGWCIGAILIKIAFVEVGLENQNLTFIIKAIMYTMFGASFLVILGTKSKHPGWFVLLVIGILLMIGK